MAIPEIRYTCEVFDECTWLIGLADTTSCNTCISAPVITMLQYFRVFMMPPYCFSGANKVWLPYQEKRQIFLREPDITALWIFFIILTEKFLQRVSLHFYFNNLFFVASFNLEEICLSIYWGIFMSALPCAKLFCKQFVLMDVYWVWSSLAGNELDNTYQVSKCQQSIKQTFLVWKTI